MRRKWHRPRRGHLFATDAHKVSAAIPGDSQLDEMSEPPRSDDALHCLQEILSGEQCVLAGSFAPRRPGPFLALCRSAAPKSDDEDRSRVAVLAYVRRAAARRLPLICIAPTSRQRPSGALCAAALPPAGRPFFGSQLGRRALDDLAIAPGGGCSRLAAESRRFRQLGTIGAIVRSDHRIGGWKPPLRPVLLRRKAVAHPQMSAQRLQLLPIFQADDKVRRYGCLDRNRRFLWCARRGLVLGQRLQRGMHRRDETCESPRRHGIR